MNEVWKALAPIAPEIIVTLTACAVLVADPLLPRASRSAGLVLVTVLGLCAALLAPLVITLPVPTTSPPTPYGQFFGGYVQVDTFTSFFRFIGGAVGVAVMGSVMAQRLHLELVTLLATAPAGLQDRLREVAAHPDLLVNPLTRAGLGADVLAQIRPAMAHAVGSVFVVGLVVAVAALASGFLVPAGQARELAVAPEPAPPPGS